MKAARARAIRKLLLIFFLVLASAFSLGISVSARTASLTPTDRTSALQSVDLASIDVQSAAAGSIPSKTDQGATSAQALANSAIEGGSTPGPRSFLLVGLVLIGVRLIISYRSRKVKNLATGTH
jgi:hypothetical protein